MSNPAISLTVNDINDDTFNELLQAFVEKALSQGLDIPQGSDFSNWTISAELVRPGIRMH